MALACRAGRSQRRLHRRIQIGAPVEQPVRGSLHAALARRQRARGLGRRNEGGGREEGVAGGE